MSTSNYSNSPSRSPIVCPRLQLGAGGASRLRSSSLKKPPEPLRRAVADCLSPSSHHGSPAAVASDASRTLRDYLAAHITTDLAYSVVLEHTLAEKERRYKPSEDTLKQIDRFCVNIIAECNVNPSRRSASWSQPSSQQSGASSTTTNIPPLPVSNFASLALVKSLDYVRSLVAQHLPKRSFQPAAFAGVPSARQSLPSLSSLLSKSFNSQLSPATNKESLENKEASTLSVSNLPIVEESDGMDNLEFIALDVLKWRWCRDGQSSLLSTEREDSPLSTFRPRARPLFQYRHYSEQQPLRLNQVEVCEVIAAVCSETPPPSTNHMTISSKLSNNGGKPSVDVAVSVLIKLVIDMYVLDSGTAAPLTLSMLEEMVNSPRLASRSRAFDLILNLGVHGHLLEPIILDDAATVEEETFLDNEVIFSPQGKRESDFTKKMGNSSAINNFETWILSILYEILLHLVQVVKALIEVSRRNSWAEVVCSKLICMLTNMFYQASDITVSSTTKFLVEQVDLIGGIEFIFLELVLSNSREERRNLYLVLFDYVLHLINETCLASGVSEYSDDEIQPVATLLMLAEAPEAFYLSVKLGVEGIGELLRRSISAALLTYPNGDRLNTLLEKVTEKLDTFTNSFSHLDKEFGQTVQITKSYKSMKSIEDGVLGLTVAMKVKLSWATLHSLLHSERLVCRQNGYVWLGELLMEEISGDRDASIWSNIRNLQQKIALAAVNDYLVGSDVPLSIWLMCGLLKSKNSIIRWGFLFVLERLLMRCKFLLDEKALQYSSSNEAGGQLQDSSRLEKANAVIDIMSCALSLVAQINETDRINILKMCDILFSQLCLKVLPATSMPFRDTIHDGKVTEYTDQNKNTDAGEHFPQQENFLWEESMEDMKNIFGHNDTPICETASMAALLLHGQAIVPMRLIGRVPAALFYWPLIQLAGAATDNIALGVSVGSKGRGNLPGATSDIRATLLLLLIGKCTADPASFQEVGGEEFFRELLDDTDSRVAYYSSTFLLKRMMTEEPENYQRMLQSLVSRAQQSNNEKLLENPYLQMRGILQLSNE
ncbi:hypothetical protein RHGRI_027561 [Rhododendron griersonianum]|uniref:ARM repeat superfamily protein n=1 Tax=Rhododendron griersonianum TaxID=479676 RepID=A0AAV6IYT5_9ERIC|nr:hypothetical protein RHGRI_027561 [Rhododendron griersonianum]